MKTVIEMAKQAGFDVLLPSEEVFGRGGVYTGSDDEISKYLERFEALVRADERNRTWTQEHWTEYERSIAAAEREACAKVCDSLEEQCEKLLVPDEKWPTPSDCAHIIRARGNT